MAVIKRFLGNDSGSTAIEYALIAILLSVAIVGGVTKIGSGLKIGFYEPFGKAMTDANAASTGN